MRYVGRVRYVNRERQPPFGFAEPLRQVQLPVKFATFPAFSAYITPEMMDKVLCNLFQFN